MIERIASEWRTAAAWGAWGAAGAVAGVRAAEPVWTAELPDFGNWEHGPLATSVILDVVTVAFAAAGICLAILLRRQRIRLGRWSLAGFPWKAPLGLLAGAGAASAAATLWFNAEGATESARIGAWALFGLVTGVLTSRPVPELPRTAGVAGGAVGGAVGACLFIAVSWITDGLGFESRAAARVVGLGLFGFLVASMIVVADTALARAWIEVSFGPFERRSLSLTGTPVTIGSDSRVCTVFAAGAAPVALRAWFDGRAIRADTGDGRGARETAPGTSVVVGAATVTFGGDARTTGSAPDPSVPPGLVEAAAVPLSVPGVPAGVPEAPRSPAPPVPQAVPSTAAPAAAPSPSPSGLLRLRTRTGELIDLVPGCTVTARDLAAAGLDVSAAARLDIVTRPSRPSDVGVVQRGGYWQYALPDGGFDDVPPGRPLLVTHGLRLRCGDAELEVV